MIKRILNDNRLGPAFRDLAREKGIDHTDSRFKQFALEFCAIPVIKSQIDKWREE